MRVTADRVSPPDSDAAVIEQSCAEPERFAAIFDRHFSDIHRYLARRVGSKAADDLAAEVFLAAFAQRQRYDRAQDSARPWLFGIATNLVGAHRRHESRYLRALARTGAQPPLPGEDDRVAERVSAAAARPALLAALAGLAPGDRDVLLLVALAGLGYPEVASALGIPYGTVASRLNRARRQLRASLGGSNPAGEEDPMTHAQDGE